MTGPDVSSKSYGVRAAFLDTLEGLATQDRGSWWTDVLMRKDVFLAVRRNYLNVYHRGASIFRIDDTGDGAVSPKTHVKYLVRQQQALAELLPDNSFALPPGGSAWAHYDGATTLNDMLKSASDLAGPEKTGLHPLVLGNTRVIDIEVSLDRAGGEVATAVSSDPSNAVTAKPTRDQDRLDVVTLEKRGETIFVVFHEAKDFSNAALRAKAGSTPPVIGQIERYRITLSHHAPQLRLRYFAVCQVLARLHRMMASVRVNAGVAPPNNLDPLIEAIASGRAELHIDPNPRLIVFGFDADQKKGLLQSYLTNLRQADPALDIYAVGDPGSALGAFRPPATPKCSKNVTPNNSCEIAAISRPLK